MKNFIYHQFIKGNLFLFFILLIGIYIYAFKKAKEGYYNTNDINDCKNELNNTLNKSIKKLNDFFTDVDLNTFNLDISKAITKLNRLISSEEYSRMNTNTKSQIDLIWLKLNNLQTNLMEMNSSLSSIAETKIMFIKNIENKNYKDSISITDSLNMTTNQIKYIIDDLSKIPDN